MPDKLTINKNVGNIKEIFFKDIVYCKAEGSYSRIYTINGMEGLICNNLKHLQTFLPEKYFYRCHRSFLINLSKITGIDTLNRHIILIAKYSVPLSQRKTFKSLIKFLTV